MSKILQKSMIPNNNIHAQSIGRDSAIKFITCGSVDDGKSTLIGRLLVDSKSVLQDQIANVSKSGQIDLAQFTDGLSAEREQGITIDVAYRYFSTSKRKFIIGDTPGHEQYTRNMITAASNADAAIVLVDATKLEWQLDNLRLLTQTCRHTLLVKMLRVPTIIFAVNKLDAIDAPDDSSQAALGFHRICKALRSFAKSAGVVIHSIVPISALKGDNVVFHTQDWCGYEGESLLSILEKLQTTTTKEVSTFSMPVQWVEKFSNIKDPHQGRRIYWGRVASGQITKGQMLAIYPCGEKAKVAQVLSHVRSEVNAKAGQSVGIILDRELDISRGDYLISSDPNLHIQNVRDVKVTLAWMDNNPLVLGRTYHALHGHRWVKAKITKIISQLNIETMEDQEVKSLNANAIGTVHMSIQETLPVLSFKKSKEMGSMILVDTATHSTAGAVLFNDPEPLLEELI